LTDKSKYKENTGEVEKLNQRIEKYENRIQKNKNRINRLNSKLDILLETTNAINSNKSAKELLDQYRNTVENDLQIRRLVLFMQIENIWSCALQYGVGEDYSNDIELFEQVSNKNEVIYLREQDNKKLRNFDFLIPVSNDEKPLCYLLIGDIDENELRMSPSIKHRTFVQTLTNIVAVTIENKALFNRSLRQERIDTELQLAAEMQSLMVGSGTQEYPLFEVATYYQPHQAIGGDFCDFIPLGDDEAFFCMADVSGKGVSAAFIMATIQAHLKALIEHTNWTLEGLVKQLNKKVNELSQGDRFITIFFGYFHYPTRMLHYINAGHNPPFVISSGEATFLEEGTVGIGMLPELPFINKGQLKLSRNALLVMSTDGVLELENSENEEFGSERLCAMMIEKEPYLEKTDDAISHIVHAMDLHRGNMPYFDDTALLCCRFK
jgi:sigma-B regulation protein RsbU (phosphoserine phosphatase)